MTNLGIPANVQSFWTEFEASNGSDATSRFYEAFHFDDNESSANELGLLVLRGMKRATASLVWTLEAQGRLPPKAGALSIVTDWGGSPLCVIETTAISVVPYEEVDEVFAAAEGEGDGSLSYWRSAHWAYFGRECARIGRVPSLRMPVICEKFEVIYREGCGKAA